MAFIPLDTLEGRATGQWVRLTRDIDVIAGRFESGTIMKIVDSTNRGLDLEDEYGNKLYETGMLGNFFTKAEPPYTEKN